VNRANGPATASLPPSSSAARIGGAPDSAGAGPPILDVRDLVQTFGARTVVDLPAWQVSRGSHSLVIGPSGCGKSTLLHLIAGLIRPSRGRIAVDGQDLMALGAAGLDGFRGRRIGIVLQSMHLIAALSVRDNLRLARWLARQAPDPDRIDGLLDELGLARLARVNPRQLSQGERQRLAIARAVINRPALVLADEPTSALDDANCAAVLDLLQRQAQASGATLIVATHDHRLQPHFDQRLELAAPP
jgi:putative ABC transport system ATP-binding protein